MCGIVGSVSGKSINQDIYDALIVLQHRGQDAAGMVVGDDRFLALRKDVGLVSQVFEERHMAKLNGFMGIGHVRYPTAGTSSSAEAQPMYVNTPFGISLAHNGNLTNVHELRDFLAQTAHRHLNTRSDSEVLLNVFAHHLEGLKAQQLHPEHVFDAVSALQKQCRGAYAVVAMIVGGGIVAFRDPRGIRPLLLGSREGLGTDYMVASENVALEVLRYEFVRDIRPGEAVYISKDREIHFADCSPRTESHTPCIFEHVYLARSDAVLDGVSTQEARLNMGEALAAQMESAFQHVLDDADVVIPIPETSTTSAIALAQKTGHPYREGFVKNRYIGRTFIMPGQDQRRRSVRYKLNAVRSEFQDKNVLLVEDSIVRGTTTREIVQQVRSAGAKRVYLAVASPPVRFPNVFGIDMPSQSELLASGQDIEGIRSYIDVDELIYQRLEDLKACAKSSNPLIQDFECSIFDGQYRCNDINDEYFVNLHRLRHDRAKDFETFDLSDLDAQIIPTSS